MGKYGLFILAFAVVTASLIKSQMQSQKKSAVKKSAVTLAQWPGVMKKSDTAKLPLPNFNKRNNKASFEAGPQSEAAAKSNIRPQTRGIASVGASRAADMAATQITNASQSGRNRYRPKGYASGGYYYSGSGGQARGFNSVTGASFSKGTESSVQELSSFTRTPDLSINVSVDPELAESFEDQIRKFREQNQLTSQELQELELITNNYLSMSGSVQRGQVPMPQVNAEAIKITRSFISLKRRVEGRPQ